jgi:fatty acid desaturase
VARAAWASSFGAAYRRRPLGPTRHLVHHMVASIPWYQQIILHQYIAGILTENQRKRYLLRPVVGFPVMFWSILRESYQYARLDFGILVWPTFGS